MKQDTFIFIGISGGGKGTQIELLKEYIKKNISESPVFYLETGKLFREFIKDETFAAMKAREVNSRGERQPDFLAIGLWAELFRKTFNNEEHMIIDGSPRSVNEAINLDGALKFLNRERPKVVVLHVSPEESEKRLLLRAKTQGRVDDTVEGIRKRVEWFEKDVAPAIAYYRDNPDYDFIEFDGHGTIEEIHKNIIARVYGK
jgi:adenylate kinase